ncbi:MAG: potassium channel protein [Candidatus Hydrogenedentota bacterium]|nr:MAG: potassium channel protein [Candidatus Hydrogenedentota bacterium]
MQHNKFKLISVPLFLTLGRILKPVIFLVSLLFIGSLGYHLLENYSFLDALYMTTITITTVGFGEVKPLSEAGKVFTIFIILGGVIFYGLAINSLAKIILETSFRELMEKRIMEERLKNLENHYIICGGGRFAYALATEFEAENVPFIIIENNPDSLVSQKETNWLVLDADAMEEETLLKAGIKKAIGLASVLPTDADNLFVVLSARRLNPTIRIETRISMESTRPKMLQAGADKVISPYAAGGKQMARSLLNPEVAEFVEVALGRKDFGLEFSVHRVVKEDPFLGKTIRETDFRKNGFLIVAIKRPGKDLMFAPSAKEILQEGDHVFLLGTPQTNEHWT